MENFGRRREKVYTRETARERAREERVRKLLLSF